MSYITISQKELKKALSFANQISPKKSDVEVFTHSLIEIENDSLNISSLNADIFYKQTIKLNELFEARVTFLINTDMFANSVNLINDEVLGLDINLEKKTLTVQGSKGKHNLRINTDLLPSFKAPEVEKTHIKAQLVVDTKNFLEANKVAQIAVGNAKTVYQSEFLHICYTVTPAEKKLAVVSTDRYRIVKNVLEAEYKEVESAIENDSTNFLINPKAINLFVGFMEDEEKTSISFRENYLLLGSDLKTLVVRYGDGKYPDYNKIIPQSFICYFDVSSQEILEGLKQVYFSAKMNGTNKSVTLTIKPSENTLLLESAGTDGYTSFAKVPLNSYQGNHEEWSQNFNSDYLISYINSVTSEDILWEANPGKPSVLSPKGQKSQQLYLVSGLK